MGESSSRVITLDTTKSSFRPSQLVSAIGTSSFTEEFLSIFNEICGAEHCSIFQFSGEGLRARGSASMDHSMISTSQAKLYVDGDFWRRDPGLLETQNQIRMGDLSLVQVDIGEIADTVLRNTMWSDYDIGHRMLLGVSSSEGALGVSLCRSKRSGEFTPREISDLERWSLPLVSMLKKHTTIAWAMPRFPDAVTCLARIEECVRTSEIPLPRREFEVCSRLIYGMTTTGIALELGIGEGSVMTYRKRIYERLHIGTQRELLIWYLSLWDGRFFRSLAAH